MKLNLVIFFIIAIIILIILLVTKCAQSLHFATTFSLLCRQALGQQECQCICLFIPPQPFHRPSRSVCRCCRSAYAALGRMRMMPQCRVVAYERRPCPAAAKAIAASFNKRYFVIVAIAYIRLR
jgi:hypothetical protein